MIIFAENCHRILDENLALQHRYTMIIVRVRWSIYDLGKNMSLPLISLMHFINIQSLLKYSRLFI